MTFAISSSRFCFGFCFYFEKFHTRKKKIHIIIVYPRNNKWMYRSQTVSKGESSRILWFNHKEITFWLVISFHLNSKIPLKMKSSTTSLHPSPSFSIFVVLLFFIIELHHFIGQICMNFNEYKLNCTYRIVAIAICVFFSLLFFHEMASSFPYCEKILMNLLFFVSHDWSCNKCLRKKSRFFLFLVLFWCLGFWILPLVDYLDEFVGKCAKYAKKTTEQNWI